MIIFAGGYIENGDVEDKIYKYEEGTAWSSSKWIEVGHMKEKRAYHAVSAVSADSVKCK